MERIKDTIKGIMEDWKVKKPKKSDDDPEGLLKKILSKRELAHIKLHYFKKGILGLNVDSSSWLYRLNLDKEGLLLKLNQKNNTIKDIRFRIGEVK